MKSQTQTCENIQFVLKDNTAYIIEVDEACIKLLQAQLSLVEKEVKPQTQEPQKGCRGTSSLSLIALLTLIGAISLRRKK